MMGLVICRALKLVVLLLSVCGLIICLELVSISWCIGNSTEIWSELGESNSSTEVDGVGLISANV